jgi:hypothetical protein
MKFLYRLFENKMATSDESKSIPRKLFRGHVPESRVQKKKGLKHHANFEFSILYIYLDILLFVVIIAICPLSRSSPKK